MLVLTRKVGEEILIGDNIRLKVLLIRGNQVRLGFTAPVNLPIRRVKTAERPNGSSEEDPGSPDSP
jgi:carbon storage regulator